MKNMKKKGFALIELLAVIVVLSVIALITVPMIMNVIEKTRKEAFKDSVLGAFTSLDYYLLENDLQDIPEKGIEVKNLELKNNPFEYGIIIKNSEGELEAVNVSDGKYCAQGEQTKLEINKGECDAEAPEVSVSVEGKKATITLTDNVGVIGYAVTNRSEEGTTWEEIEETKSTTKEWEAEKAGEYTAWVKDKYGKTNSKDFTIEKTAFCEYQAGDVVKEFAYTGNVEEFTVPCNGTYKLEVWGAQGGGSAGYGGTGGGTGGYAYGQINLKANMLLYVVVGSRTSYNGGGTAKTDGYGYHGGGGATHIAVNSNLGILSNYNNNREDVVIVAGGGGGSGQYGSGCGTGGLGGGTTGGNGVDNGDKNGGYSGKGGSTTCSQIGTGGNGDTNGGGGGGGWCGGGGAKSPNGQYSGGGGGSGYLNETLLIPDTTGMENGKQSGNGKAQITLVSIAE